MSVITRMRGRIQAEVDVTAVKGTANAAPGHTKTRHWAASTLLLGALGAAAPGLGGLAAQTLLLRQPTVSARQIAFGYANNIWIVDRAGGDARRLTSFGGATSDPHLSPDGQWVAFSGQYGGNTDVYLVPVEGGEPKRLTWHPLPDL